MEIIEETTALGVPFCHFRTSYKRNQYNLTFTKTEEENVYEVHLIPLVIHYEKGKIVYDKAMRIFVCEKVIEFMLKNKCDIYFNINCIGLGNEFLVWKFLRWMKSSNYPTEKFDVKVTENTSDSIRLFEFKIRQ
jgi:hypothetical protein